MDAVVDLLFGEVVGDFPGTESDQREVVARFEGLVRLGFGLFLLGHLATITDTFINNLSLFQI
jgi:hypothetical protein